MNFKFKVSVLFFLFTFVKTFENGLNFSLSFLLLFETFPSRVGFDFNFDLHFYVSNSHYDFNKSIINKSSKIKEFVKFYFTDMNVINEYSLNFITDNRKIIVKSLGYPQSRTLFSDI